MDPPTPASQSPGPLTRPRGLWRDVKGGVGVIAALALPAVLGATGLAYDVDLGLAQRVANQRAADMGALAAATAYTVGQSTTLLQPTARDVALANGITGATVSADVVEDYPAKGARAVRVRVSTTVPYTLGRLVHTGPSFTVSATAYASLSSAAPNYAAPCMLALANTGDAFAVSGGASISAPDCAAAAVGSFDNEGQTVTTHDIIAGGGDITNNSGTLAARQLRFGGKFINPSWNTGVPSADKRLNQATTLTDPWASSSELAGARALLGTYTAVPTLTNPQTANSSARDYSFDSNPQPWVAPYRVQTSGTYNVPVGTYNIKRMSTAANITVNFASGSTIYIDGGFANANGSTVNFGNSNVYVNGGFDSGSNGGVTFGNCTLWIGSGAVSFQGTNRKGNGDVMINASVSQGGKLTMGTGNHAFAGLSVASSGVVTLGAGGFTSTAGVSVGASGELALGDGDVLLGPAPSSGYAISLDKGARMLMGDGAFSANGSVTTAGGSALAFGRTGNHLINGGVTIAGVASFGAGRYTIARGLADTTGGDGWAATTGTNGKSYGSTLEGAGIGGYNLAGINVTFILRGTLSLGGGTRSKLVAATSSTSGAQIGDMLIHSLIEKDTSWGAGGSSDFAGTVYLPSSKVTLGAGSSTLASGQCFTLIASRIAVTGGTAAGVACATMTGVSGTAAPIRLLQ